MSHLLELPNELVDLVVANLERQDAFAMRCCCRILREATWNHCAKTWFSKLTINGFDDGVKRYVPLAAQPRICRSIKHLCIVLDPAKESTALSSFCDNLCTYFSSLPNLVTLTLKRAKDDVHWKKRTSVWYTQHEKVSYHILQILLNLLVTPNQLRTLDIKSSDFKGWSDGLLRLDALSAMVKGGPLLQETFANLVSLSISLNTSMEDGLAEHYHALPDFLKAIPTLEELTIAGTKRPRLPHPPLLFRELTKSTRDDGKLPCLKRLRLRFFPVELDFLVLFTFSHIGTLARLEMDHVLLLEKYSPRDPLPRSLQVRSDWSRFLKKLDGIALVRVCTWELLQGQPERAQRINLTLLKTPAAIGTIKRAIEEGTWDLPKCD